MTERAPPRVKSVRVRNYRALRDVALTNLTPLTVLLNPNGSGKSTVFDVSHRHRTPQRPDRYSRNHGNRRVILPILRPAAA